jgi:hypothetical protein
MTVADMFLESPHSNDKASNHNATSITHKNRNNDKNSDTTRGRAATNNSKNNNTTNKKRISIDFEPKNSSL